VLVLQAVVQVAGDGLQMRLGGTGADDEEIREAGNAAKVDGDDVFGFFVGGDFRAEAGEGFSFDGADPGRGDGRR
jgi:hypothetical protein